MPAALKGLDPNKDGVPLCFDRNLAHGCKRDTWQTPAGLQCEKGLHLCMKCGSPDHGAHACSNWCLAVGAGFATSSEALSDGPAAECVAGPSSAASEVCTPAPQLDAVRISPVVPALAGEPTVTVTAHAGRQPAFDSNFSHPASQPLPAGRAEVSTQVGTSERSGASDADALSSVPARAPEVRACVAVELFAGSCRLSKCLRSAGFETIAVDVKDAVGHQALKLDLLSAAGLTVLWDVLSSGQILYVQWRRPATLLLPLVSSQVGPGRCVMCRRLMGWMDSVSCTGVRSVMPIGCMLQRCCSVLPRTWHWLEPRKSLFQPVLDDFFHGALGP